jgi:hypothetical protein
MGSKEGEQQSLVAADQASNLRLIEALSQNKQKCDRNY